MNNIPSSCPNSPYRPLVKDIPPSLAGHVFASFPVHSAALRARIAERLRDLTNEARLKSPKTWKQDLHAFYYLAVAPTGYLEILPVSKDDTHGLLPEHKCLLCCLHIMGHMAIYHPGHKP